MLKNNHIDLSNGEQIRNFLYIDDLISAIIICIKNIKQLEYNSNIDITSNDNLSIKELANLIKVLTNSKSDLNFDKLSIDKREFRMVDFDNIKIKRLGWKQKNSLITGIKNEIQEIKNEISKR
jgi:nucleoside-diphosphate-sugar epimerase